MKPVLRPLWHLVSRYPLMFVPFAVLLVIIWGLSPDGFDAFHVVWNDDVLTALGTGLVAGLFFGGVMFLVRVRNAEGDEKDAPGGSDYVLAWVLVCVLAVVPAFVGGLFPTTIPADPDSTAVPKNLDPKYVWGGVHRARVAFPAGVAVALVFGYLGYKKFKPKSGNAPAGSEQPVGTTKDGNRFGWLVLKFVVAGYVLMSAVHWVWPRFYWSWIPASVTAVLFFWVLAWLGSLVPKAARTDIGKVAFYPIVFALLLGVVFLGGFLESRHKVPGMDVYYDGEKPKLANYEQLRQDSPADLLADDRAALQAWQSRMTEDGKYATTGPVIVVSVSGGASTSAVFVARALFRLELRFPGFVDRVRIITGASGGMLGAAYFVSQLRPGSPYRADVRADFKNLNLTDAERAQARDYLTRVRGGSLPPENDPAEAAYAKLRDQLEEVYVAGIEADFLSPLFQKWIHKDFNPLAGLLPRGTTNDRGTALEYAWDRTLKGRPVDNGPGKEPGWNPDLPALGVPFHQLRDEEKAGRIPSLVFTPMMVEDGRQLIISNLDLNYMTVWGSYDDPNDPYNGQKPKSYSAVEFYRLFPKATSTFNLGTAVRLNASFPVISPAAELPTDPPRRVVDAGYYDNYGLIVPVRWLERNAKLLKEKNTPVWFLQLWTYGYDKRSTSLVTESDEDGAGSLRSSTAPLTGLFSAWRSNMAYRGEERLNQAILGQNLDRVSAIPPQPPIAFRIRKDIGKTNLPMNWVLTSYNLARIDAEAESSRELTEEVKNAARRSPDRSVNTDAVAASLKSYQKATPAAKGVIKEQVDFAAQLYRLPLREPAKK